MAVSARYGYHRDELYFLAAGHHLAFGYVDQPPLTPLLARLTAAMTGNTLAGLRGLPALALAALVVLTAAMSRQLGAGRTGQLLAALATATCAEYLGAMHLLTTTTPDFVFWAVTLLLVLRLLASGDPRWWVAVGGCIGVASEAKWNIGFLAGALVTGFAATPSRRLLASRWFLAGVIIAAALAAPDVIWQAAHGAAGSVAPSLAPQQKSKSVPFLSEPWYCCAEPTPAQFVSIGGVAAQPIAPNKVTPASRPAVSADQFV